MRSPHPRDRRRRGNAVLGVVAVLLLLAMALGGNYVRNYQTDMQQEKQARPYAKYGLQDLQLLAEGYRTEVKAAEARHGGGRVETRTRHHFSDQVQEFERVQRAARSARDQAIEVAQTRDELKKIEEEIQRRADAGGELTVHLERMFRF
jgi:hypothetical protein